MKRVLLYLRQYSINKIFGNEFELALPEGANVIDAINEVDRIIASKGKFPSDYYHSLLHWLYHPIEKRFYKQASIIAYTGPGKFLNIRDDPKKELPEGVIVHVNPEGPCITEGEDIIDYETFKIALQSIS
jgi:hypothetical protein